MASTIKLKNGSGAPLAGDLVQGEPALDLTNKRLYTEDSGGTVIEVGTNPAAEITANAGIALPDNQKATFGASDDLQIYSDGDASYISEVSGTGNLEIKGAHIHFVDSNGDYYARFLNGSKTEFYHDGSAKLATTSTGVDVTGTVTADKFESSGNIEITASTPAIQLYDTDVSGRVRMVTANAKFNIHADFDDVDSNTQMGFSLDGKEFLLIDDTGDISFYDDTGVSQSFYWDASAERLGIGTTSPAEKLDISAVAYSANQDGGIRIGDTGGNWNAGIKVKSDGSGNVRFAFEGTSGSEDFCTRLGNVGIGTSSPSHKLDVSDTSDVSVRVRSTGTGSSDDALVRIQVGGTTARSFLWFGDADSSSVGQIAYQHSNDSMQFYTSASERMRIDSSGNLLVGTTDGTPFASNVTGAAFYSGGAISGSTDGLPALYLNRKTSDGVIADFRKNGTSVGSISVTGSATTYNTSSDQRLKENITDAPSSSDDIDAIQVRSFDWKADGSHQKYGMIAQELMTVAPEAVSGDPESDEMMGVDYSKLVPMLIKEIQSLRARVAQLETN
jgi:hypothetical protein